MTLPYPLTVAALEAWLKQFPADARVRSEEGEIVVASGSAEHALEAPAE